MTSTPGTDSPSPAAAPTSVTGRRSIAPDLARGFMLVLIAVANVPYFVWGRPTGTGAHSADGSIADRVVQTVAITGIDSRVYPMFAFLFGYGIVQLYTRQLAAGTEPGDARRILRRRHWWMLAFGFVHAALLWYGDILGAYAITGLALVWLFLRRSDRALAIWAGILVLVSAAFSTLTLVGARSIGGDGSPTPHLTDANAVAGYWDAMSERVTTWAGTMLPTVVLGLIVPVAVLLGMLAARHRVLDAPSAHVALLRRCAVVGITIGWGTGLLLALQNLDILAIGHGANWGLLPLHTLGGLFGGLGYVAVFGLLAVRLERDGAGTFATAVQALGKRSMSGYLAQSVVFSPLLAAWGLGLGQYLSSWSAALLAAATWAVTVAIAVRLEAAGRRGPAETLLRRLAYPR
ncbi:DUF418 domain-containing protein [Tsukamurella ocularis]|uniref:DUF418 domain-containing protein n=1 Tax=Tsukamurella ocularis TaxID=1970234 RepID=UPI0021671D38|nr:DUF418 domain-containing protein [Tsukamurella ocularis]MCS3781082.1 putative membrane protein YeiB [Tsukamurella ocularis]MCS3786906.1 putative membrane protein YeiB [Tsukamurella ocularis]MCS3850748.1 putative membrane protein YeiB [Tsukamurella ocularis]